MCQQAGCSCSSRYNEVPWGLSRAGHLAFLRKLEHFPLAAETMHIPFGKTQTGPRSSCPGLAHSHCPGLCYSLLFMGLSPPLYLQKPFTMGPCGSRENECLYVCQPRTSYNGVPELQVAHSLILSFSTVSRPIRLYQHNLCCIPCQCIIPNTMYFP